VSAPDTLAFHAAGPGGDEGAVVVLHRPDAEGRVRSVEWSAGSYLAPGRLVFTTTDDVMARVAEWRRIGWKLSESPARIESWLRNPPPG